MCGITLAKGREADDRRIEIHVAADEPMRPERIDREGSAEVMALQVSYRLWHSAH
jgi:hypothetical protein